MGDLGAFQDFQNLFGDVGWMRRPLACNAVYSCKEIMHGLSIAQINFVTSFCVIRNNENRRIGAFTIKECHAAIGFHWRNESVGRFK